ncbi:hypothetical protein NP493_169g05041 [Ridgeia piscesae]|uniref:Uncharacterized protein n=1 Tax=Ridgeia piscesae TaxID=27915 RepID=A0AAD9P3A1_RIDPI|nr:hypothetical protein NP493_169g05041 [Ridgeia piscesae]
MVSHCFLSERNECNSRPCRNGATCHDEFNAYSCTCVNGYIGSDCQTAVTQCPADVIIVIDNSWSMHDSAKTMRTFVKNIVSSFQLSNNKTRIGVITFTTTAHTRVYFGNYRDKDGLLSTLDYIIDPVRNGGTDILVALKKVRSMFRNDDRFIGKSYNRYITIFITDGDDHQLEQVRSEAREAHDDGIVIISIGIGEDIDVHEIYALASKQKYALIRPSADQLAGLSYSVAIYACEAIDECDSNPCKNGATCNNGFDVYTCTCMAGYTGYNCETGRCESPLTHSAVEW